MPGGFEPQTNARILSIPITFCLEQGPLMNQMALLVVPDGSNSRYELLSVGFVAETLPIDTDPVTFDLEYIDDSNASDVATLRAAYDMETATVRVYNTVWRGSQIMEAGDVINAEFDTGLTSTPDTAADGAALIVEYRVLQRS